MDLSTRPSRCSTRPVLSPIDLRPHADAIQQRQVEVRHRRVVVVDEVPVALEPGAAADEQHRQVLVRVLVAVARCRCRRRRRVVEQRAVAVGRRCELADELANSSMWNTLIFVTFSIHSGLSRWWVSGWCGSGTPISGYVRRLPSRPIISVETRVRSACNASACRSNISFDVVGEEHRDAARLLDSPGSPRACRARRISIRRSISRTDVRYSSTLRRSCAPSVAEQRGVRSATTSRMLRRSRRRRALASPDRGLRRAPNRRSKTSRGFVSGGIGEVGLRHERLFV